jgi:hypothetical protein
MAVIRRIASRLTIALRNKDKLNNCACTGYSPPDHRGWSSMEKSNISGDNAYLIIERLQMGFTNIRGIAYH